MHVIHVKIHRRKLIDAISLIQGMENHLKPMYDPNCRRTDGFDRFS